MNAVIACRMAGNGGYYGLTEGHLTRIFAIRIVKMRIGLGLDEN